jgi:hypothetical protein
MTRDRLALPPDDRPYDDRGADDTIVKGFRPSPILDDSRYAPVYAAGQA